MRGAFVDQGKLFSYISPEARVPANHPLRKVRELVRDVLGNLNRSLSKLYASEGRPSIPPEQLLSALLLQMFYGVRSERQLMEQLDYNLLYRWFVGLSPDDPVWDPTVFTKNRDRLQHGEVFAKFMSKLLNHPQVRPLLEGGEILTYGARTIAAGGWQSLPRMEMPGALVIGDAAGVLNLPKAKGVHQAIRCGTVAAEHVAEVGSTAGFDARWRASPGGQELRRVRNFKPGFRHGLRLGLANAAVELATGGHLPWTLVNHADAPALEHLSARRSPERRWLPTRTLAPRDREAAVFAAGTQHDESQPPHLRVADLRLCVERCSTEFGNPCLRFCPAAVYEMTDDGNGNRRLQVNAANCVHCKACDIKDPYGNITWVPPEGGSGPNYTNL